MNNDKLHKQLVTGFGSSEISPATMAYKMHRESLYVNESVLQYLINYVIIMAESKIIPLHLQEVQQTCKTLYSSLQELGLTGTVGRVPHSSNEFLLT